MLISAVKIPLTATTVSSKYTWLFHIHGAQFRKVISDLEQMKFYEWEIKELLRSRLITFRPSSYSTGNSSILQQFPFILRHVYKSIVVKSINHVFCHSVYRSKHLTSLISLTLWKLTFHKI